MILKKIITLFILVFFAFEANANSPRSTGKYKNWESYTSETDKGKICFAQSSPVKRAPSSIARKDSRIFVTFRPSENIIVKARTDKGAETTDHYSMMGFTKAYNTARKSCN